MNPRITTTRRLVLVRPGCLGARQKVASRMAAGLLAIGCCLGTLLAVGWAGERTAKPARLVATAASTPTDETSSAIASVDMFDAMKSGDLEVKFIPKDDREARVMFKNKTKRPLSVRLPEAFAAVPVLAQRGGVGGGGMGGMGGAGGMNQPMGGGMGGMGGGMGGGMMGGMGGGMMNLPAEKMDEGPSITLAPEKIANYRIATVCLEHGKRDPRPAIPYRICPLENVTTKPGVAEMLTLLGYGKIDQRGAQAAAWHLANGMTWEQLAAKRIETIVGDGGPYFTPDQVAIGVRVAEVATSVAENRPTQKPADTKSPGDPTSGSGKTAAPHEAPSR